MEKRAIILLDIDYITEDNIPVIRLFGKDENGRPVIALDRSFRPYIYAVPSDIDSCLDELVEAGFEELEVVKRKDLGRPVDVIKIILKHPQEVPRIRKKVKNLEHVREIREHDIPFYRRYLIDNGLFPMSKIELKGNIVSSDVEIIELDEPPRTIKSRFPKLEILAFDIEVYNPHGMPNPEEDQILMISFYDGEKKRIISTKGEHLNFVEVVEDEKAILERFTQIIKDSKPDLIVGYNSDNFDFPYIRRRADLLGVKLDIGWDGSTIKSLRRGFTTATAIKGTVHVDLYPVMRRYINLDTYTLERVYFELFGEKKVELPGDQLWEYWDNENLRDQLFKYSIEDVTATYKIAEKILPLNMEITRIVGQPLFDISRMATGQQVEWFLIRKAFEYGELVPNKPSPSELQRRRTQKVVGGYVKEPEKGLHENLVQFDFRSLYPSIIISKNISPDTFSKDPKEDCYVAPETGYRFRKKPKGFVPSIIGQILDERMKIKNQMKVAEDPTERRILDVQQEALKRLANTMYGVYGYTRFRWYCLECAEAITAWGRNYIKKTIKEAEKFGFHTVYADTDGFYATYQKK
ncbi:MAG: DNA-directed DNA polymerase [Methanothermobacter sp.]|nr:DNA-directed DNA polymerase [Methanothermobacter sp.]